MHRPVLPEDLRHQLDLLVLLLGVQLSQDRVQACTGGHGVCQGGSGLAEEVQAVAERHPTAIPVEVAWEWNMINVRINELNVLLILL